MMSWSHLVFDFLARSGAVVVACQHSTKTINENVSLVCMDNSQVGVAMATTEKPRTAIKAAASFMLVCVYMLRGGTR